MRKKREDVITVRITKDEHQILQLLTEKSQLKQSDLIRQAVSMYFNVFMQIPQLAGEHIIFHHDMLKVLLENATDTTLHLLAETSFHIGMFEDAVDKSFKPSIKEQSDPTNLEHQLKTMATFVFSNSGQRWFQHVSYTRKGENFSFGGQHTLGRNFSQFIVYLMQKFGEYYFYQVQNSTIESHRVIVNLIPKMYINI